MRVSPEPLTVNRTMFLQRLLQDPPPLLAFEIGRRGVAGVRLDQKTFEPAARAYRAIEAGVIEPSPGKPNVQQPEILAQAVRQVWAELGPAKRPDAALMLPDASSRLTVLDFDHLPSDTKERLQLIRFRLKKAVPFDVESARVAYQAWKVDAGFAVLAAATPAEIIKQYEQPLEAVGLQPGHVSLSTVAALNLAPTGGMSLFVKLSEGSLTMIALDEHAARLVRSVELTQGAEPGVADDPNAVLDEMIADLYPTFVFIADNLQRPVTRLILSGFDGLLDSALARLPGELGCEVEPLRSAAGMVGARDAGIEGFLSQN